MVMFQLFTWLLTLESVPNELFVEDIEAITDNSGLRDVILVPGDFNLPKVKKKVGEESGSMMPLNVT
jgi:hypothetical protein